MITMITNRTKLNFVTIRWTQFCIIITMLLLILFIDVTISVTLSHNNVIVTAQQQIQQESQYQKQQQEDQKQQIKQQERHQQQLQQSSSIKLDLIQKQEQQHYHSKQNQEEANNNSNNNNNNIAIQDVTVRNFSPKMDNNEWRPVGRGDPLQNDPTFDYSPPALERVRYWAETANPDDMEMEKKKEKEIEKLNNDAKLTMMLINDKLKKTNLSKNEILLLSTPGQHERDSERIRNLYRHNNPEQHLTMSHTNNHNNNIKIGEIPLLQPKYPTIRRSYYAQQLPTHLMPPPPQMPNNIHINVIKSNNNNEHQHYQHHEYNNPLKNQHPHQHQHYVPHQDQHHNLMPNFMTSAPITIITNKPPYYNTMTMASTVSKASATAANHLPHNAKITSLPLKNISTIKSTISPPHPSTYYHSPIISQNYDIHLSNQQQHKQESTNYFTYTTKPLHGPTNSINVTNPSTAAYSVINGLNSGKVSGPMMIRPSPSLPRKSWLHNLLQKEIIKTSKDNDNLSSVHNYSFTKYNNTSEIEVLNKYKPIVAIATTATAAPTTAAVTYKAEKFAITATTTARPKLLTNKNISTTTTTTIIPLFVTIPNMSKKAYQQNHGIISDTLAAESAGSTVISTTTYNTPKTTIQIDAKTTAASTTAKTILNSNRLVIPNINNLSQRPTIAPPAQMTTDSMFKHYKQPEKPLRGPMYLIIEGHSKVKTYGKDELDPHKPKIVPIIPKREPIIRFGNLNEKFTRGTPETFQVKHLHTGTMTTMPTTNNLNNVKFQTMSTTTTTTPKTMTTEATLMTTSKPDTLNSKTLKLQSVNRTQDNIVVRPKFSIKPNITTTNRKEEKHPTKLKNNSTITKDSSTTILNEIFVEDTIKDSNTSAPSVYVASTKAKDFLSILDDTLSSFFSEVDNIDVKNETFSNVNTKLISQTQQKQQQLSGATLNANTTNLHGTSSTLSSKITTINRLNKQNNNDDRFSTMEMLTPEESQYVRYYNNNNHHGNIYDDYGNLFPDNMANDVSPEIMDQNYYDTNESDEDYDNTSHRNGDNVNDDNDYYHDDDNDNDDGDTNATNQLIKRFNKFLKSNENHNPQHFTININNNNSDANNRGRNNNNQYNNNSQLQHINYSIKAV